jgi:hypothetical protein
MDARVVRRVRRAAAAANLSWRERLGQHTWFFLHTVAAKYPEHPTEADQQVSGRRMCEVGAAHVRSLAAACAKWARGKRANGQRSMCEVGNAR